eukprot:TRINITY_DN9008_c0_g1_i1.p2 TRINITY_DN9008_c0_g1~~TRINITY_DN9008_c0_g1_i1.p2  ORF type:complete len:104 (+),score=18.30 TRINITY_DN9008_c0_g1_i1:266-577(+)
MRTRTQDAMGWSLFNARSSQFAVCLFHSVFVFPMEHDQLPQVPGQRGWIVLPYTYNALKTLPLSHPRMWDLSNIKNLHFINKKPWEDTDPAFAPLYQLWHAVF